MGNKLHKNYQKACNLIIAALLLDPIEFFISKYLGMSNDELVFELLGLVFIAFTAYVARRGVDWVKYILLILTLLGVATVVMSVKYAAVATAPLLITVLQVIVMAWATFLLFQIPRLSNHEALDSDI
jgi:hypothetical protein